MDAECDEDFTARQDLALADDMVHVEATDRSHPCSYDRILDDRRPYRVRWLRRCACTDVIAVEDQGSRCLQFTFLWLHEAATWPGAEVGGVREWRQVGILDRS